MRNVIFNTNTKKQKKENMIFILWNNTFDYILKDFFLIFCRCLCSQSNILHTFWELLVHFVYKNINYLKKKYRPGLGMEIINKINIHALEYKMLTFLKIVFIIWDYLCLIKGPPSSALPQARSDESDGDDENNTR